MNTVRLLNPWTHAGCASVTWEQVSTWCAEHVHRDSREGWLRRARQAFDDDDGATLGAMIIGS